MGLYRTEAVVLGHKKLGEADKILTLFSPEKGKIHAVARGVCRPRNHLIGGTQLFSYSSFLLFNGKV
jgi:DNA repair protein RecO (recombination protein O)